MRMKVKEFCAIEMTSYTNFKGTYYSAFPEKVTNYVENSTYKRFQNYSGINYMRNGQVKHYLFDVRPAFFVGYKI